MKTRVLFVCIENSCRSQMAEGYARKLGGESLEAWSAGSRPSGKINSTAVEVMKEEGVDLTAHASKGLTDLPGGSWDYVVTMGCGDACPFVPAKARQDWDIPDPKNMALADFRKVRDQIRQQVLDLIREVVVIFLMSFILASSARAEDHSHHPMPMKAFMLFVRARLL